MTQLKGTSTVNGLHVGHTVFEIDALMYLCVMYEIKKFVEVGVHVGGLANIIHSQLPDVRYLGIEENPGIIDARVRQLGLDFIFGDCFSENSIRKVGIFLDSEDGTSLVYCDNGNKPKEIIAYHNIIHKNDLILTHDYYDGVREPDGLEGFGLDLEFPKPEVYPEDVKFLQNDTRFVELSDEILKQTRIIGFERIE